MHAMPHQAPIRLRWLAVAQVSILVASLLAPLAAHAAVWTDQQDYAPGSVVTISGDSSDGTGYVAGNPVDVAVSGPNGWIGSCSATVADDELNSWSCQVTLDSDPAVAVGDYSYTAIQKNAEGNVVSEQTGAFSDNVNVSISSAAFAWKVTGPVSGGSGFDVAVSGTYTCTTGTSGSNIGCSSPTGVTVDVLPDAGGSAVGGKTVSVSTTGTNQSWSTTLQFRTSPSGTQIAIPADGKYDLRATLVATFDETCTTACQDTEDKYFGVDNGKPTSVISLVTATAMPSATGTAADATSGFENSQSPKPVHVEIRTSPGDVLVAGSGDDLTLTPGGGLTGSWSYAYGGTALASGGYCIVSKATDVAGNVQDPVTTSCFTLAPADTAPSVSSTTPADGATGVARNADIGITFSEPVNVSGSWFALSCGTSASHAAAVTGGPSTFTLNPVSDFAKGELCTVTVYAASVTDQDTSDPPDNMAANYSFSFTTVANLAPSADAGGPYSGDEGEHVALDGTGSSDADGTVASYAWAVTPHSGGPNDPDAGASCSFVDGTVATDAQPKVACTDDGVYDVTLTVTDNDGATDGDTTTLTLSNANPTATKAFASNVDEGSSFSLALTGGSDPGSNDTLTYAFDCGDGSGYAAASAAASTLCPTSDDGTRSVKAKIIDDDLGSTEYTDSVTVANVAPTIAITGAASVNEGSPYSLTLGAVTDPGTDTVTAYIVHWGDGTSDTYPANGVQTHTYADGPNPYAITVDLTDEDGTFLDRANALSVAVANVAPVITSFTGPTDPVALGTAVTVNGAFTDAGILDTHTATINWGDGSSSSGAVSEINGSGTVSGTHVYTAAGIYSVLLAVTDKDGGADSATFQYVVVYDPNAGFVTGGGWINSPAGAYLADVTLTGKATFGFVSKYKKGATTPDGNTEFQFHAAGLNFKSTSYQWLVVSGAKATYKGQGTINGSGNYGFLLSAIDGQLTGGGGADKFRIKIWDKDDGDAVVYDNLVGGGDDANPTTTLGGGSIVIHTGKK